MGTRHSVVMRCYKVKVKVNAKKATTLEAAGLAQIRDPPNGSVCGLTDICTEAIRGLKEADVL
jgi:hypothetical protein